MCSICKENNDTTSLNKLRIMLDEARREEDRVTDADTHIRSRAAHFILVNGIVLSVLVSFIQHWTPPLKELTDADSVYILLILFPGISFGFSIYHSYCILKKRKTVMFSPVNMLEEVMADRYCIRILYKKLLMKHKKHTTMKNERRDNDLLPHLDKSMIAFFLGILFSVLGVLIVFLSTII